MLADVIDQTALGIVHLIARDGGLVAGRADARRSLVPALPGVSEPHVEFRNGVQGRSGELAGDEGNEQIVVVKNGVRPDGGRDLVRLALLDLGACSFQGMVMRNRQLHRLIEVYAWCRGGMLAGKSPRRKAQQRASDESPRPSSACSPIAYSHIHPPQCKRESNENRHRGCQFTAEVMRQKGND